MREDLPTLLLPKMAISVPIMLGAWENLSHDCTNAESSGVIFIISCYPLDFPFEK